MSSDRVAFVAAAASAVDLRGGQAHLDAEAMSERLRQPDAEFEVVAIDARDDVAGQLDDFFAGVPEGSVSAVVLYASARVAMADGEPLIVLDEDAPDTGDALADVAAALADGCAGASALLLLDLRAPAADAGALTELSERLRAVVRSASPKIELALSVRAAEDSGPAASCSPFTRAILAELDDTDPSEGLYGDELIARVKARGDELGSAVLSFVTAPDTSLALLIAEGPAAAREEPAAEEEVPPASEEGDEHERPTSVGAPPLAVIEASRRDGAAGPTVPAPPPEVTLPPAAPEEVVAGVPSSVALPSAPALPGVPSAATDAAPVEAVPTSVPPAAPILPPAPSVPPAAPSVPPAAPSVPPATPSVPPARPSTPPTGADVLAEGDRLAAEGDDEEALARFRKALALVGGGLSAAAADRERARIYVRIGEAKLRQKKAREGIASLEKGLSLMSSQAADDGEARAVVAQLLETLHALHLAERDARALHAVEERLLSLKRDSSAEAIAALLAFGRTWLDDLGDPLRARERFEHVLALAPDHHEAHRLLLKLAEREGRAEDALALKRRLAELDPDRKARALQLFDLAKELLKRSRDDEAFDLLESALDADPSSFEPLVLLSKLLGERQEWAELEGAYRRMLDRSAELESSELKDRLLGELHKRLGLLLLEHFEDEHGALEELGAAIGAQPLDVGLRRSARELALKLGRLDEAREQAHAQVMLDPLDVLSHRALFDVLVRSEEMERAFHSARVLTLLGVANDRERAVYNAHKEEHVGRPTSTLSADVWADIRSALPPFSDEGVELVATVFRAAGDALVGALVSLVERAGRLPKLDEAFRVDAQTSTVSAARGLSWAAQTLGVELPAVYLEDASSEALTGVLRREAVTVIGAGALRGRSVAELAFLSGFHLSGHLHEHRLARLCPALDELAACFLAAVVVAVPDTPVPERIRPMVELLAPEVAHALDEEEEQALDAAVLEFEASGGRADLVAYTRAVERASLRAGLLLAGDLEAALGVLELLPEGALTPLERKAELLAFTVSDLASVLRSELGAE